MRYVELGATHHMRASPLVAILTPPLTPPSSSRRALRWTNKANATFAERIIAFAAVEGS